MASTGTNLLRREQSSGEFRHFITHHGAAPTTALLSIQTALCVVTDLFFLWAATLVSLAARFPALRFSMHLPYRVRGGDVGAHAATLLLYSGLVVLFAHTQHLYSSFQLSSLRRIGWSVLKATAMAGLLLTTFIYLSGDQQISRLVVVLTVGSGYTGMVAWRVMRARWLRSAPADGINCHHVLIAGSDAVANALKAHLDQHRELGLHVKGMLVPNWERLSKDALGTFADLEMVVRAHFIDEIIVCGQDRDTVKMLLQQARECGVGVRVVPDLYDGLAVGAPMTHIGKFPALHLYRRQIPALALMSKRVIDVLLSGIALFLLAPVFLLLAILVKLDSKGPVFYVSRRVGRKGAIFSCYKFRTMVTDAEKLKAKLAHLNERDGVLFKISNDPRITRIGRYLRKYSLDELAQLWNVFRGDMSLVGPRPPLASEVQQYQLEHLRRLEVAPGITGLWQIEARTSPSFDRYIELDLNYVRDWNLLVDLKIILRTVTVVFAGTGT